MIKSIPGPTVERLIQLSRLLEQLESGSAYRPVISSAEIEQLTGWTSYTIRRDISLLNANGATAAGYDIKALNASIRDRLRLGGETKKCCVVGLGRLGSAFLEYEGFRGSGFDMVAGFDSNVNRTEILQSPFPLYPAIRMQDIIQSEKITFAILAVPVSAARQSASRLAEYGVRGIVNFTPCILTVPQGVEVENVSIADILRILSARIDMAEYKIERVKENRV